MAIWERAGVSREEWAAETLRKNRTSETYDLIEHAIDCEHEGRERDELTEALHERIDEGADEQRLLSTMPVAQIVTLICRDLGIRPNWSELEIDEEEFDPDERTMRALRLGKYEAPDVPPPSTPSGGDDFSRGAGARGEPDGECESAPADPGGAFEAEPEPDITVVEAPPNLFDAAHAPARPRPPDPRPWMA
jgi:hypothetical protein